MNELSALISKARDAIPEAIQDAAVRTVEKAVDEAPKYSGQLRASMRIGLNSPDLHKVIAPVYFRDAVSDPEGISRGRARQAMTRYKRGDTIYISNDQDYAAQQEYEAGHLFMTKAARTFSDYLDQQSAA